MQVSKTHSSPKSELFKNGICPRRSQQMTKLRSKTMNLKMKLFVFVLLLCVFSLVNAKPEGKTMFFLKLQHQINPLQLNLKSCRHNNRKLLYVRVYLLDRIENIGTKGEDVHYEHVCLLSYCFQKFYTWERANCFPLYESVFSENIFKSMILILNRKHFWKRRKRSLSILLVHKFIVSHTLTYPILYVLKSP